MTRHHLLAPISLIFAAIVFLATLPFTDSLLIGLVHAFSEASLVGGLADWFAVVALFRHPFGIPIPHTAIILRHRDKLTASIIDMVQNNWLTKGAIRDRIRSWRIIPSVIATVERPSTRRTFQRMLLRFYRENAEHLDVDILARFLVGVTREHITTADIISLIQHMAGEGISQNLHQTMLSNVLPGISKWLQSTHVKKVISMNLRKVSEEYASSPLRKLGKWMAERSAMLDYEDLADSMIRTLKDEINGMLEDHEHPLRITIDGMLRDMVTNLGSDAAWHQTVDTLREKAVTSPAFTEGIVQLLHRLNRWTMDDLSKDDSSLMSFLWEILDHYLKRLKEDSTLSKSADTWIQDRIITFVEANHDEIGLLVRQNLQKLNDAQLVEQLEARVGPDLQYIRLNGAVVGGMVGAILFLFKHAVL